MSWPDHAHTAADREHAGREGVALTEDEAAEASTRALADDLCAQSIHPRDEEAGDFHCQECYDLACTVHDSPWFARLAAQPVPAPSRTEAEVKAEALRAVADDLDDHGPHCIECEHPDHLTRVIGGDALRARADRILRDAQPTEVKRKPGSETARAHRCVCPPNGSDHQTWCPLHDAQPEDGTP